MLLSCVFAMLMALCSKVCCVPQSQSSWTPITKFPITHSAVVRNAQQESLLPPHLKNRFYQDPRIARALAYNSWFAEGERPVYTREAEKIPRREIYNVLVHAGFIPRQRTGPERLRIF